MDRALGDPASNGLATLAAFALAGLGMDLPKIFHRGESRMRPGEGIGQPKIFTRRIVSAAVIAFAASELLHLGATHIVAGAAAQQLLGTGVGTGVAVMIASEFLYRTKNRVAKGRDQIAA